MFALRREWRSLSIRVPQPRRLWSSLLARPEDRKLFLTKREGVQATIINGNAISKYIRSRLSQEVQQLVKEYGRPPSLAVVLVGDDPASHTYVGAKTKAAQRMGITDKTIQLPGTVSERDLLEKIVQLNQDDTVDGLIVQLPVPDHISTDAVCNQVKPSKDVDGYTIINLGKLHVNDPIYVPATARGVRDMVELCGFETEGKNVCVVGSSRNVGAPIARIFSEGGFNATVTVCHKYTPRDDLAVFCKLADFLVVCTGKPGLISADMVKPGAVVVDVGINQVVGADGKAKLIGDVEFDGASKVASAITPVPGGVGPLTVIGLMLNTVDAYKLHMSEMTVDLQRDISVTADA